MDSRRLYLNAAASLRGVAVNERQLPHSPLHMEMLRQVIESELHMEFTLAKMVAKAQMLAHPRADLEAGPAELTDWFTDALDSIPYLGALMGRSSVGSAKDRDRAEVAQRYEAYRLSLRKPDEPGR